MGTLLQCNTQFYHLHLLVHKQYVHMKKQYVNNHDLQFVAQMYVLQLKIK